ncbi:DUF4397 domain-containing protein [Trinickia diaoshuihuensis]|jgi:hypothetical protein|uniref:DUF4397 domain-containing protein n=1 Tax=Trinickia diaoshuihuensis TaxID=2292265 RepID=UPI000E282930|nr:DUF4397 domain-containing protein [Trinickia diaoshuihuensis]
MKTVRNLVAFAGVAALLAACGGGSSDVGKEVGLQNPEIHFVNAVPLAPDGSTAPNLDLFVNGSTLSGQTNVPYKGVTNFANIGTGSTQVGYGLTGTSASGALASGTFPNVANGHEYTVIALPSISASNGYGIGLIDDPFDKGLLSNSARLRSFNASPNAPDVDVYIVPPGTTSVSGMSPTMAGISYGNAVPASGQDSLYLSGGTYMAIVTAAGSSTPIYESAQFSLGNNADWLISTVPAGGVVSTLQPGQIHLLVAQGGNTSQPALELPNALTGH